ncbi:hypothetical protein [Bradyrhizobium centrolobii]|nr:hypothetical protein [Bradyrhizobium centrolobii]
MHEIGVALLVGGMALVCAGAIFLIPEPPGARAENSLDRSQAEIELHLREIEKLWRDNK